MTKDEALKLALEALEETCGNRCNSEYNPCHARTAITAIKEALAQDEQWKPDDMAYRPNGLAQPAQEPSQKDLILQWIIKTAGEAKEPCSDDPESLTAVRNAKVASIADAAAQALGLVRGPAYTTPPKAQNFCPRCGKRTPDLTTIHTCTPPRGLEMT
jgi:hypothetical protein